MATEIQWDSLPNVEEQTQLENPIKIRWSKDTDDRRRLRRAFTAALEDGWTERAIGVRIFHRQKTQIVIETEEELEAFENELNRVRSNRSLLRIRNEIEKQTEDGNPIQTDEDTLSDEARQRKENTDMDELMEETIIPHARKVANDVWPGGTVDVDEIDWFWNPQLRRSAGRCYAGTAVPKSYADSHLAVGLAPEYYYKHGIEALLKVVRHELIHCWEYNHPDCTGGMGHGPKFKQWIDDLDTHRHCKFW